MELVAGEGAVMWGAGILILAASVIQMPVAAFVTFVATRRPSGPQPATYGHLQTLVDLVDEWSLRMFWGHKGDGVVCHAGTTSVRLSPVRLECMYAMPEPRL